jgi:hypothetical protein
MSELDNGHSNNVVRCSIMQQRPPKKVSRRTGNSLPDAAWRILLVCGYLEPFKLLSLFSQAVIEPRDLQHRSLRFVAAQAAVMDAVPEIRTTLPPTAIGKDYPYDGRWLRLTPSDTEVTLTLAGYGRLTFAWVEGIEINILGAVAGLDLRRPVIKLPGLGRLGMRESDGPATCASDASFGHLGV